MFNLKVFNLFFIPSASSLLTPSFTALGAASTMSFASLRPNPVNSLTALTTCNFAAPDDFKITSNSVCSSPASAPPPPAEGMKKALEEAGAEVELK